MGQGGRTEIESTRNEEGQEAEIPATSEHERREDGQGKSGASRSNL